MKSFPLWLSVLLIGFAAVAEAQVVINEIHYDPSDKTKPLEFVEFHNPSGQAINVGGWRLDDGVGYVFPANTLIPAGGYFVVAQNAAAFQAQFGFVPGGVFTGSLSNQGERLPSRMRAQ